MESTTVGNDFVFGFIVNYSGANSLSVLVSNANDQPTNVIVTSIYPLFLPINIHVSPNTVKTVREGESGEDSNQKLIADIDYAMGHTGTIR